jgi:hypothetical protein
VVVLLIWGRGGVQNSSTTPVAVWWVLHSITMNYWTFGGLRYITHCTISYGRAFIMILWVNACVSLCWGDSGMERWCTFWKGTLRLGPKQYSAWVNNYRETSPPLNLYTLTSHNIIQFCYWIVTSRYVAHRKVFVEVMHIYTPTH